MAYFVARAIGSPTDRQCRLPLHSGRCRPRQLRPLRVVSRQSIFSKLPLDKKMLILGTESIE
jgi:hypothetical protein